MEGNRNNIDPADACNDGVIPLLNHEQMLACERTPGERCSRRIRDQGSHLDRHLDRHLDL
jgi:hypothetical protein